MKNEYFIFGVFSGVLKECFCMVHVQWKKGTKANFKM